MLRRTPLIQLLPIGTRPIPAADERLPRARPQISGPDVDEVIANLDLPIADFNAALANSLAQEINGATRVALFKARWLNRAMILAVGTILFLSLGRVAGGPGQ